MMSFCVGEGYIATQEPHVILPVGCLDLLLCQGLALNLNRSGATLFCFTIGCIAVPAQVCGKQQLDTGGAVNTL
jgi:hypothetical protein